MLLVPNPSHRGEDEIDCMGDCPGCRRPDTCSGSNSASRAAAGYAGQPGYGPRRGDRSVRARAGAEPRCGERARALHSGDRQSDRHAGDRDRLRVRASREAYRRSDQGRHGHPGAGHGDRPRRRHLPQHLAARPLRDHQHLRSGAARLRDAAFPPRREPDAVPHVAQHCARSDLDARPGPDPRRQSRSRLCGCSTSSTARRRPT